MGILGDKLSYLPGEPQHQQEPLYERRADMREMVARQALSRQQGPQVDTDTGDTKIRNHGEGPY